jgi:hypothetical protein
LFFMDSRGGLDRWLGRFGESRHGMYFVLRSWPVHPTVECKSTSGCVESTDTMGGNERHNCWYPGFSLVS